MSAADKTGNVLDKIASKFKGLEKALEGVRAPVFVEMEERANPLFDQIEHLACFEGTIP